MTVRVQVAIVLLMTFAVPVCCSGKLAIKVTKFSNPSGRNMKDSCCDGVTLPNACPTGMCDNQFILCGSTIPTTKTPTECDYGTQSFNGPYNENSNEFKKGDVSLLSFDKWMSYAYVFVFVRDIDTDGVADIDFFSTNFSGKVSPSDTKSIFETFSLTGSRSNNPTSLNISISVYCDKYYYGADCTVHCTEQDDCGGHYTCNRDGNIVCIPGYIGPRCTEPEPGRTYDCSVYDGADIDGSTWKGFVTCNQTNRAAKLTFTTGNRQDGGVSASLTYRGETTPLVGEFNVTRERVVLNAAAAGVVKNIDAVRQNNIHLVGSLRMNGTGCYMNLTRTSVSFGECGPDTQTCVRTGRQRSNFYCCCIDGTSGTHCGETTSTRLTTTMSSTSTKSSTAASTTSTTRVTVATTTTSQNISTTNTSTKMTSVSTTLESTTTPAVSSVETTLSNDAFPSTSFQRHKKHNDTLILLSFYFSSLFLYVIDCIST